MLANITPVDQIDWESPGARMYSVPFTYDGTWGRMRLPLYVACGPKPGKTIVAIGGTHGDEYEGPVAYKNLVQTFDIVARDRGVDTTLDWIAGVGSAGVVVAAGDRGVNAIAGLGIARINRAPVVMVAVLRITNTVSIGLTLIVDCAEISIIAGRTDCDFDPAGTRW